MTPPQADKTRSLTSRLVLASLVWILLALSISGVWLVYLFQEAMDRRFRQELDDHLVELVAATDLFEEEAVRLIWTPADSRFQVPFSGWYWEVVAGRRTLLRSRSLMGKSLIRQDNSGTDEDQPYRHQTGPEGGELGVLAQWIQFPEREGPLLFIIAGPREVVQRETRAFAGPLAGMLAILGISLMVAVVLQVRFGLIPLTRLRQGLAKIRGGELERLPENFPGEVLPLVREMNALLAFQSAFLERVRSQSGDLAHALKNPLAILRNEANTLEGESGQRLRQGLAALAAVLDDRLAKARMAGTGNLLAARTALQQTVGELCISLGQLYRSKEIRFDLQGLEGLYFRGDGQDLEELLGNLLDNACKWSRGRVAIAGHRQGNRLHLLIHDDGPGVSEADRHRLMQRGQRLDEAVPGSGLGLSIAANLVSLYQGEIQLNTGPWGGLAVAVDLPVVD